MKTRLYPPGQMLVIMPYPEPWEAVHIWHVREIHTRYLMMAVTVINCN